jgi:hypothetical protein
MSGMVGVIANDTGRYSLFTFCLTMLRNPPNTQIQPALTSDRILGRNKLAKMAVETGSEWLLFIDDDHVFHPDLLHRLLAHNVDIVGSLYLQRMLPFAPVAYSQKTEDERYIPLNLAEMPEDGLVEVAAIGTGGMLIRSEVFHALEYPYFEHGRASEDLIFCDRAREAGFTIHCDLGSRLGHMTPTAIWPSWVDEEWVVGYSIADNFSLYARIENPAEADLAPADAVKEVTHAR